GADADYASVPDEFDRGFPGRALLCFDVHVVPGCVEAHSSARIACHCDSATGSTDKRLPRRVSAKSPRFRSALISSSVMVRFSLRTKRTSTSVQRGLPRSLPASKYGSFGSNWPGSGYGALATFARPAI